VLGVPLAAGPGRVAPELGGGLGQRVVDADQSAAAAVAPVDEAQVARVKDGVSDT
jgi:hypothetical protein